MFIYQNYVYQLNQAQVSYASPPSVSVFDIIETGSGESYVFCAEETRD